MASNNNRKKGPTQPQARRIALVMVDTAGILSLLKEGLKMRVNFEIIKGLPADAVAEHVFFDNQREGWCIIVRSESFEPVEFGMLPPTLPVEIQVS